MVYFDGLGGLLMLGLLIFCFLDCLLTPDGTCRNLPKLAWVFIVLLIPLVGPLAWLVAGRPWNRADATSPQNSRGPLSRYAPAERSARPSSPDDDEEFLAGLRKQAEEQRRRAAREQQERDLHDGESG